MFKRMGYFTNTLYSELKMIIFDFVLKVGIKGSVACLSSNGPRPALTCYV